MFLICALIVILINCDHHNRKTETDNLKMLTSKAIQMPDGFTQLNLTNLNFSDDKEEPQLVDVNELANVKRCFLDDSKLGPKNSERLFESLEKYNFEIVSANNTDISKLATHFANNKTWNRLKLLQLKSNGLVDEAVIRLAQNNTWNDLRILRLSKNLIGNEGAIALGKSDKWKALRLLDLSHNRIKRDGAFGLAGNRSWIELVELDLQYNFIDDESSIALGRNGSWKNLQKLSLKGNSDVMPTRRLLSALSFKVSTEFSEELKERKEKDVESLIHEKEELFKVLLEEMIALYRDERREELIQFRDSRDQQRSLKIETENIDKEGHFLWLPKVEQLRHANVPISTEQAYLLSTNMCWKNLMLIDFSNTKLGDEGVTIIGKNTFWMNLRSLDLSFCGISDEGCRGLAQNTSWEQLQNLNLACNAITEKGANYLSQNLIWTRLEELNFQNNKLRTILEITPLINNKTWKHLQRIWLEGNKLSMQDIVLFFGKRDAFTLPQLIFEFSKHLHCVNVKFSKLIECDNSDLSEIMKMNERFQKEILELSIWWSQTHGELGKYALTHRNHKTINRSFFHSESFILDNAHLIWFPEAKILDLTGYACQTATNKQNNSLHEDDSYRDKYDVANNIYAGPIISLLRKSLWWIHLEELKLINNGLTDKHLSEFENIHNFPNLKKLSLDSNNITDKGALSLIKNEHWKNLEELNLSHNFIRNYKTATFLFNNKNWTNFKTLNLWPQNFMHQFSQERSNAILSWKTIDKKVLKHVG